MSKDGLDGFRLYIPTRGRVEQQTTWRSLPPALQAHATLVCPAEEAKELRARYPTATVVVQPRAISNIAEKRAWIVKVLAHREVVRRAAMIDDDCYFFARCPRTARRWDEQRGMWVPSPGAKLLSVAAATPARLLSAFAEWNALLKMHAHAGLGSRNGNHTEPLEVVPNGRMMHAIGYDVATFKQSVRTGRGIVLREDFDYNLQLLSRGYENRVIHHTVVSPGSYGAKGGCSDERTVALSNAQAQLLAELHPGLVRVVEKRYNNHPRMEVQCSWKKALLLGGGKR